MVTAAWVGSITGMPSAFSSGLRWRAMPAQPITSASAPSSSFNCAPDIDHALERLFAARRLGDRHFERALTGKAVGEPHLEQIAHVPGDRALADGDDAEASGVRERGQDAAFSDAEDRPRGALAADVQPWIAVAGNHKGVGGIVCLHHPAQRHHDAFDVGLGLDPKWAFRKGGTHDLRTVRKSQRVQCSIETSGDGFI